MQPALTVLQTAASLCLHSERSVWQGLHGPGLRLLLCWGHGPCAALSGPVAEAKRRLGVQRVVVMYRRVYFNSKQIFIVNKRGS